MSFNAGGYLSCVSERGTGEQTARFQLNEYTNSPSWPRARDLRITVVLPTGIEVTERTSTLTLRAVPALARWLTVRGSRRGTRYEALHGI